jgi:hypothetical protein
VCVCVGVGVGVGVRVGVGVGVGVVVGVDVVVFVLVVIVDVDFGVVVDADTGVVVGPVNFTKLFFQALKFYLICLRFFALPKVVGGTTFSSSWSIVRSRPGANIIKLFTAVSYEFS